MKIIKCSNGCGRDIEDKKNDPLKMCWKCATSWMLQQYSDKTDVKRLKK